MPGSAMGIPAHDGTTVYFLTVDRDIVALDATTGRLRWRAPSGITDRNHIFGSTTAGNAVRLAGDVVVAGDWDVVGFDRDRGRRLWVYVAPGGDGPGLYLGDVGGGTVYAGSPSGHVYAIDASTGRVQWLRSIVEPSGTPTTAYEPALSDRFLAVGYTTHGFPATGGVAALDPRNGRVLWRTAFPAARDAMLPSSRGGGPVWAGDVVLASSMDGHVHAFDSASGAILWSLPRVIGPYPFLPPGNSIDHRALTVAGTTAIVGSMSGIVTAYDLESRQPRWQSNGNFWGSTAFSLSADARFAYVPYLGGTIIALDLRTGEERWRFGRSDQGFIWAPLPVDGMVFAAGAYAGFFALASPDPRDRAHTRPEKPR